MGVLAALLLESDDLLALAVADDFALDRGALDQRRADLGAVAAQHQDFEIELGAHISAKAFHLEDRVLGNPILLSAGADDRVHGLKPLKEFGFPRTRVPERGRTIRKDVSGSRTRFQRPFS